MSRIGNASTQAKDRKFGRDARKALSPAYRAEASEHIAERVIHSHEFMSGRNIACYLSTADEVATEAIIMRAWRMGKRIFTPVCGKNSQMIFRELVPESRLERKSLGIWEPVGGDEIAARQLDVVITPLAAFDHQWHRIGMGAGYFDTCFAFLSHRRSWLRPKLIGVAFECQKVEKITPNPWDIRLYRVITEAG